MFYTRARNNFTLLALFCIDSFHQNIRPQFRYPASLHGEDSGLLQMCLRVCFVFLIFIMQGKYVLSLLKRLTKLGILHALFL